MAHPKPTSPLEGRTATQKLEMGRSRDSETLKEALPFCCLVVEGILHHGRSSSISFLPSLQSSRRGGDFSLPEGGGERGGGE